MRYYAINYKTHRVGYFKTFTDALEYAESYNGDYTIEVYENRR